MNNLLRLCAAIMLATTVTACDEMPTASMVEVPAVRRDGVTIGGGFRTVDGDTATTHTISGDLTTTQTQCSEERGGWTMGGGFLTGSPGCD